MQGCIFCEMVDGTLDCYKIYENDWVLCVLDLHPANMGHCLLMPKDHFKDMFDIDEDNFYELKDAIKTVVKMLKDNLNATKVKVIHSTGEGENDTRFHMHVHLIPHYEGENLDFLARGRYTERDFQHVMDKITKC